MSLPVFPRQLPKPERENYGFGYGEQRRGFEPDHGPLVVGWKMSQVPNVVNMSLTLDRSERAVFERFYEDVLQQGTLPFLMRDPTTDGWPVLLPDGRPFAPGGVPLLIAKTWLVMFATNSKPGFSMDGPNFRYSFSLSVMP